MPEQLQKIGNQILEWWKKFSTKQKMLLISIAAVIILALVILAVVVGKPTMVPLIECTTTAEAGKVKSLLDEDANIRYEISQNGLVFTVDQRDEATASILLGTNNIPTTGFEISSVFDGGFSSTEADKTKRYKRYLEEHFAEQLEILENVESASIILDIPNDDGTILARDQESYASVILTLSGEMDDDQAMGVAQYIATQLGNDTTDNIRILDSNANVLFSGGDSSTSVGAANSQLSLKTKTENLIKKEVKDVMVGSSLYDHVEAAINLDMDFDQRSETSREFYAPEGQTDGMVGQKSEYEANSVGGAAAVPGTDANDDPTYVIQDNDYSSSTVTDTKTNYQNNERVTNTTSEGGKVNYDTSSISLVATNYVIYDEDTLKASGALDDMTFDEYIAANSEPVRTEVDPDYLTMVANATGFPEERITIIAQNEPVFQYSSGGRSVSDYLQIVLVVLIFALLGYVVFRSTRKDKTTEIEPELSVERLLESTKESVDPLENIGYTEKSETRLLIEKFVEENPEAAAALLRNWLNEEWE